MKHQKLDEFLKSRLDNTSTPVPKDIWASIEEQLDQNDRLRHIESTKLSFKSIYKQIIGISVAASVALILGINLIDEGQDLKNHIVEDKNNTSSLTNTHVFVPSTNNFKNSTSNQDKNQALINQQLIASNQIAINYSKSTYTPRVISSLAPQSRIEVLDASIPEIPQLMPKDPSIQLMSSANSIGNSSIYDIDVKVTNIKDEEKRQFNSEKTVATENSSIQEPDLIDRIFVGDHSISDPVLLQNKKSVVAIGGGYNYGTLDQGYALTLSSKKDINQKWFIQGNFGVLFNDAGSNQSMVAADFLSLKKSIKQNVNSVTSTIGFNDPNDYIFLQFSPILGYNISKSLNVGLGPDYQHLISNLGHDIIYFSGAGSGNLLPSRDFGLLGKADYKINSRFNAGLIYRSGINSFIRNNINIQNRNYFQIQINYILNKK